MLNSTSFFREQPNAELKPDWEQLNAELYLSSLREQLNAELNRTGSS